MTHSRNRTSPVTRGVHRGLAVCCLVLLVLEAMYGAIPKAYAAGSVSVAAWICPGDLVTEGITGDALAVACGQQSDAATFALSTGGLTRRRIANPDQPAVWPAVDGEFQLSIETPSGEAALANCELAGVATLFPAPQGKIAGTLAENDSLHCDWYRLTSPAIPVATSSVPTPSATEAASQNPPDTTSNGGQPSTPASTGNPSTGEYSGQIDIGGRSLFLSCTGTATPTILLEAGGPGGSSERWAEIRTSIAGGYRICHYDRAGVGQSDPAAAGTRTIQDSVNDLRALITTARLGCPCVMVGESWGANIVRLYAGQYPADVSGLVLIDPIPPGFLDNFLSLVPADTPGFSNLMGSDNAERMDQLASLRQADTATIPPQVPAIVIMHGLQLGFPLGFPVDQLEAVWRSSQEKLTVDLHALLLVADLSSNSIIRDQPDIVVQAIQTIATAVADPANTKSTLIVRRTDDEDIPQPGACFQIWLDAGNGTRGDYKGAACDKDADGVDNGSISLIGLDPGDYVLQEITTPSDIRTAPDKQVTVSGFATHVTVVTASTAPSTPTA